MATDSQTLFNSQKNRDKLSWFARRASTWLLKKVKERRSVKAQALNETCKSSGNWKTEERGEVSAVSDVYRKGPLTSVHRTLVEKE